MTHAATTFASLIIHSILRKKMEKKFLIHGIRKLNIEKLEEALYHYFRSSNPTSEIQSEFLDQTNDDLLNWKMQILGAKIFSIKVRQFSNHNIMVTLSMGSICSDDNPNPLLEILAFFKILHRACRIEDEGGHAIRIGHDMIKKGLSASIARQYLSEKDLGIQDVTNKEKSADSPRTFIMRWNATISNYSVEEYLNALYNPSAFPSYYEWSVWDYNKVRTGDRFFMVLTGWEHNGIVMAGTIVSPPYIDQDWMGRGRTVHYVRLEPNYMSTPDNPNLLTTEELQKVIPDFNWENGHSGELLPPASAKKLEKLMERHQKMEDELDRMCSMQIENMETLEESPCKPEPSGESKDVITLMEENTISFNMLFHPFDSIQLNCFGEA